jgi:hypothetical protein
LNTALNRATTYQLRQLPTGATRRVVTDPAGLSTITVELPNGRDSTTLPDGTRFVVQEGAIRLSFIALERKDVLTVVKEKLPSTLAGQLHL